MTRPGAAFLLALLPALLAAPRPSAAADGTSPSSPGGGGAARTLSVSRFASEGLDGWEEKSFAGSTDYRVERVDGRAAVRAESLGTASGRVRRLSFDPSEFRFLRWSWKVAGTVYGGDERKKGGDDYAARVYVIFPGPFFWQTRAINYIWANRLPRGEALPNAFTSSAMMVAVESGPGRAGTWVEEERDLLADYRRLFGTEPGRAGAVAIMTDTDNTGEHAVAWYGEISLRTGP